VSERSERTVLSGTAALRVHERGSAGDGRPTLVFTHGWPDDHDVWGLVADRLEDRFHVVAFDVRGVGGSTPALTHKPFTLDKLAADIDAVIAAVSPDRPVHLVGHDWGAVQGWEVVQTPAFAERIASFTSLSGPCLDHTGAMLRSRVRRPTPGNLRPVFAQGIRSAYTVVLSAPLAGTWMWRLGFGPVFRRWLQLSEGVLLDGGYPGPDLAAVAIAAVPLYRQNIWSRLRRPDPRPVGVPVQLIVATKDNYVSPRVFDDAGTWVADLTRTEVPAGHWSPRTHPDALADLIGSFVDGIGSRTSLRQETSA
jgi:pimeloyl-ACP methyl ester carboxylesterase